MNYGDPELTATACLVCGCREVFRDVVRPGKRERPVLLRCCFCWNERDDLELYEEAA
jgi:hypothetical protein